MTRLAPVLLLALLICASCSDPQHGAYRVNRLFGFFVTAVLVLLALMAGAVAYKATRVQLARRRLRA